MSSSFSRRNDNVQAYLPRGGACVSCRRRKMKCDGTRPVCTQCDRAGRPDDCEYIAGQERSTVQILEDNISRLEARIQELQKPQPSVPVSLYQPYGSGSTSSSSRGTPVTIATTGARSTIQDPPRNIAEALLANFMPYASDFGFFLNLPRFRSSMLQSHAPGHPSRPAACLIFAIYLWSIRISPDANVRSMEDSYVRRATEEASIALTSSHPQRILHSIQAEVLLATYFFAVGRFLEGKYHVANAISTTVSAGLHKTRSGHPGALHTTLSPPQDPTEEGERILAAWTVFNLDKSWAIALDTQPNLSQSTSSSIDTPWPLEMEEFEQGFLPSHVRTSGTVTNFLSGTPTPDAGLSSRALEAKAVVLWERVASFVQRYTPNQQNLGPFLQEFTALSNLLDAQVGALPPVTSSPSSPSTARIPPTERARRILIAHSIMGAAVIRLHAPLAANGRSDTSRRRRVDGARAVLGNLVAARGRNSADRQEARGGQAGWLNPVIGSTWVEAAQVLFDEIASMRSAGADSRPLIAFLQQAVGVMAEFGVNIPLMNFQVQKIQETFTSI